MTNSGVVFWRRASTTCCFLCESSFFSSYFFLSRRELLSLLFMYAYLDVVYSCIRSFPSGTAVNLANVLCAQAELDPAPINALRLLTRATELYEYALTVDDCREDPTVYSNCADCVVSLGERYCAAGNGDAATQCFEKAVELYETSW